MFSTLVESANDTSRAQQLIQWLYVSPLHGFVKAFTPMRVPERILNVHEMLSRTMERPSRLLRSRKSSRKATVSTSQQQPGT